MYPRALAPPWEDIEICPCLGVSLCVSLPLPPVPLPGLPIWLVWFSEALIPSGLRRGTTAVAPRSPPSLCVIPCVLPSSPAPLTPSACCCLITWLGAKSAVIKTAHSLFSWLFQKGEEQELKWDSHVSASLDGGGEGRRIVYPGPGLGVGGVAHQMLVPVPALSPSPLRLSPRPCPGTANVKDWNSPFPWH